MDRTITLRERMDLPEGRQGLGEVALDPEDRHFTVSLERNAWPEDSVAEVLVELWDRDESRWVFFCSGKFPGGPQYRTDGTEATHATLSSRFPEHGQSGRQTRCSVVLNRGLNTRVALDIKTERVR